jgi:hypothetical protein
MPNGKKTLVAQHLIEGQFPILWYLHNDQHIVSYGPHATTYNEAHMAARSFADHLLDQATSAGRIYW